MPEFIKLESSNHFYLVTNNEEKERILKNTFISSYNNNVTTIITNFQEQVKHALENKRETVILYELKPFEFKMENETSNIELFTEEELQKTKSQNDIYKDYIKSIREQKKFANFSLKTKINLPKMMTTLQEILVVEPKTDKNKVYKMFFLVCFFIFHNLGLLYGYKNNNIN